MHHKSPSNQYIVKNIKLSILQDKICQQYQRLNKNEISPSTEIIQKAFKKSSINPNPNDLKNSIALLQELYRNIESIHNLNICYIEIFAGNSNLFPDYSKD